MQTRPRSPFTLATLVAALAAGPVPVVRSYYHPGERPMPRQSFRGSRPWRSKSPATDADHACIARADAKRARKAERRRREAAHA